MSKAKVKKWLNKITKATKQLAKIKDFSNELGWCNGGVVYGLDDIPCVHLDAGIHEIGEMFGLDVTMYSEDERYKRYKAMWNDVMLIQLDIKEI